MAGEHYRSRNPLDCLIRFVVACVMGTVRDSSIRISEDPAVSITVFDYGVKSEDLVLSELDVVQLEYFKLALSSCENLQSHGFQEVLGYIGRRAALAIGGHWKNRGDRRRKNDKFVVTSFGFTDDAVWIFNADDGVVVKPIEAYKLAGHS